MQPQWWLSHANTSLAQTLTALFSWKSNQGAGRPLTEGGEDPGTEESNEPTPRAGGRRQWRKVLPAPGDESGREAAEEAA